MSGLEALKPFLPMIASGGLRLGAGIAQNRVAQESADRLRAIGQQDARLRAIQARRLLGDIEASGGARGVTGQTQDQLEISAARLEGIDVARARFRFDSLAHQVEERGRAALFGSIVGLAQDVSQGFQQADRIRRTEAIEDAILASNRTVIQPRPQALLTPSPKRKGKKAPATRFGFPT